ncbi:MAG: TetR family transcriptional regulator [Citricoccus sp.]
MRSTRDDQNTRARIRDAAILRFARDGLEAPLRSIAADAGVSAALIMHHFGSRAGLRLACDEHVQAAIRDNKSGVVSSPGAPTAMLAQLAKIDEYAPLVGYVLRCLQAGGEMTTHLVDGMVADAVEYLREGVREGTVSPSRDPEARARLLTDFSLGSLLLNLPTGEETLDLDALPQWFEDYAARILLPALELFTEPLLTDSSLLDAYLDSSREAREQPAERTTP